jgi:hypothetical protein
MKYRSNTRSLEPTYGAQPRTRGIAAWLILGAGLSLALFSLWRSAHFGQTPLYAEVQSLREALKDERARADELESRLTKSGASVAPASRATPSEGGSWGVQLASFTDEQTAQRAWSLMARQPDYNGLSGRLTTHPSAKGPVYRLLAGPFKAISDAESFCKGQPASAVNCMPVLFNGTLIR